MGGKSVDRDARAAQVLGAAKRLFLELPKSAVTVERLASEVGMTYWQVYKFHGGTDGIHRAVIRELMSRACSAIQSHTNRPGRVADQVRGFVAHLAGVMRSDEFRELVYLLVRSEPQMCEEYDLRIRKKIKQDLVELIRSAGEQHGLSLIISDAAARRHVRMIEAEFAFHHLLDREGLDETVDVAIAIRRITSDILASTSSLEAIFAAA